MTKPLSNDLRKRLVSAVDGEMTRQSAVDRFVPSIKVGMGSLGREMLDQAGPTWLAPKRAAPVAGKLCLERVNDISILMTQVEPRTGALRTSGL